MSTSPHSMNARSMSSLDGIPSDLMFVRYTASERHHRLVAAAQRQRLRRWCRS